MLLPTAAVDDDGGCLLVAEYEYVLDVDVFWAGCDEVNDVGYVEGGEGYEVFVNHGFLFVAVESDEGEFGFDVSGCNGADFDVVCDEVEAHSFGEGIYGVFGGCIDVSFGINFFTGDGAYIDDVPGLALYHAGYDGAGDVEESFEVGVYHLFPVSEFSFVYGVETFGESCVVDEDADVTPFWF